MLLRMWRSWNTHALLVETLVQLLGESAPQTIKHRVTTDPEISLQVYTQTH